MHNISAYPMHQRQLNTIRGGTVPTKQEGFEVEVTIHDEQILYC
jgi:hypothetical protein